MPFASIEEKKAYNKAYYQANKYKCEHGRQKSQCKDCGGSGICEHKRERRRCKECGGSSICEHNRRRSMCKECGGSELCEHNKRKSRCVECGGSQVCEHKKQKSVCVECGGSSICEHKKRKSVCVECGGSSICEHNKRKSLCIECGGSSFCEHNKQKHLCIECGGSSICEHKKVKYRCRNCITANERLVLLQRHSVWRIIRATNIKKTKPSIDYLGCSAEYFKEHIEKKMKEGMTFDNIHLDHIKPVTKFNLEDMDELLDCCHYSNFQPLLASDNMSKSNKWSEADDLFWNENIKGKEFLELYIPK